MSSGTISSDSNRRRGYVRSKHLLLEAGVTEQQFSNPEDYNFAIVDKVKGGDLTLRQYGILNVNYTTEAHVFSVCHPISEDTDTADKFELYQQRILSMNVLPKGTSSFTALPPLDHNALISMFDYDANGTRKPLTGKGFALAELQGCVIHITRGNEPGTVEFASVKSSLSVYTKIINDTRFACNFFVGKPPDIGDSCVGNSALDDKSPDFGLVEVINMDIGAQNEGEVDALPYSYLVFLLQTRRQTNKNSRNLHGNISNTPSIRDYVQIDVTRACAGDNVIAFLPNASNEKPYLRAYARSICVPVDQSLVENA